MLQLTLGTRSYGLATSLRVVYALRDISHANDLQEAIASISKLDLDGQCSLLYAAYKAGDGKNDTTMTKEAFVDAILDNLGIFAISDAINKLTEGLLYSGLSPEEVSTKKAQMTEVVMDSKEAGTTSSVKDTI